MEEQNTAQVRQESILTNSDTRATEVVSILNAAAAAVRGLPGHGAAIEQGRKSPVLRVIAPSGESYTLKVA